MRKAVGVHTKKAGLWIFSEHRVMLGRSKYVRIRKPVFQSIQARDSRALQILIEPGRSLWAVSGEFYWDHDGHTAEEIELVAWDRSRRKEAKVERLRKIKARPEAAVARRRELIHNDVHVFVWNKDQGRCVTCGVDEDLHFDHIIAVAKGGASSIENLQLLCGECNRLKSDSIVDPA